MTNLYRQNTKRDRKRIYAATALAIILFLGDVLSGGAVRSLVHSVATSLWGVGSTITENVAQSGFFSSRASLAAANRTLSTQLAAYEQDEAAYTALEAENKDLRAIVHLVATTPGITAPVTSSFSASPYNTFLVGAGSDDGVRTGNIVVTVDNFVLGTVSSVDAHQSVVNELFAPHTVITATIKTTNASLSGWGGGNARASIARGVAIAVGDPVVAPSLGGRPIGIVGKIDSDPSSADTEVYVYLPVNRSGLRFVYIVK